MLIRNRFRTVARKQSSMSTDHHQTPPPQSPQNQTTNPIIQSLLSSPRFKAFTSKPVPESDPSISPTSILDSCKPFSPFRTPFPPPPPTPKTVSETKRHWDKLLNSKGIGVALIDDSSDKKQKPIAGFKLRVQIPPPFLSDSSPEPPKSPANFGIKTRIVSTQLLESPRLCTECLSVTEMELSEDYTCVISRKGTNPKTTHIFDDCVVENYFGLPENWDPVPEKKNVNDNFLSFCYTCKKSLEQKSDIFIYRGEKAFCSGECRYQEMLLDAGFES